MAEAWARRLLSEAVEPFSAGTVPKGLDPLAIEAMAEAGVDISGYRSKSVDELREIAFDLVVTVCSAADENCPVFPGARRKIHAPFDDPPRLAEGAKTREEALAHYRRVRDEIREFVARLPEMIGTE
ncbi:MAG: arsenate reductase ArsC [Deltaproteobacteria bacterium]|nr:arsenate reductase ArsC [Deltaproteobacteria bacterium]